MAIRIYDNGGKTLDRYTVLYMDLPRERDGTIQARAMSDRPFHPLGFGQWTSAIPGRHLGKRIAFEQLPKDCQQLIRRDMES